MVTVLAWKTAHHQHDPANYRVENGGLLDFHRAVYAATEFFLEGGNPYGPEYNERDPVGDGYPLFSPAMFVVYAPLGLLPYPVAAWVFFAFNVGLAFGLAWMILWICRGPRGPANLVFAATLILASRPGYNNLYLGQQAFVGTLGTWMALHFARTRPWLGGVGIFFASLKPTFAVPLFIFMIFRRDFACAFRGLAISAIGALIPVTIIAFNNDGFVAFFQTVLDRYSGDRPGIAEPGIHYLHIDLADNLAKFAPLPGGVYGVSLLVLAFGALVLLPSASKSAVRGASTPGGAIIMILILLCIYHSAYDLLLLALPLAAIYFRSEPVWTRLSTPIRFGLLTVLTVPLLNHLIFKFDEWFPVESLAWKLTTSINCACMLAALAMLIVLVFSPSSVDQGGAKGGS
ncbi:MAG: glycosyltransferase family 87 protein [Verrucomicrobiota bacterium]